MGGRREGAGGIGGENSAAICNLEVIIMEEDTELMDNGTTHECLEGDERWGKNLEEDQHGREGAIMKVTNGSGVVAHLRNPRYSGG